MMDISKKFKSLYDNLFNEHPTNKLVCCYKAIFPWIFVNQFMSYISSSNFWDYITTFLLSAHCLPIKRRRHYKLIIPRNYEFLHGKARLWHLYYRLQIIAARGLTSIYAGTQLRTTWLGIYLLLLKCRYIVYMYRINIGISLKYMCWTSFRNRLYFSW